MKAKKNKNIILLLAAILFLLMTRANIIAQPYYFYRDFISDKEVNIIKLNLNNSSNSIFIEGIYPLTVFKEDSYQKWLITALDGHIKIYDINNSLMVEGSEIEQSSNKDLFIIAIPDQDLLFLSISESVNEWIYETNLINYETLEMIRICSLGLTPFCFSSFNGDFIYQLSEDSLSSAFIEKYSTELNSIISITYLSTILINIEFPTFQSGYLGKALFCYNEIPSDITTKKYVVYDVDNENLFTPISYPYRSYGYLTPNAEYVIIQKALRAPALPGGENFTGEINIYNPTSGALLKELTLPPDGEILMYDNYPKNIYYAIDIEEPTRQIYTLKMDSIFNELDLESLDPDTVIINSPGFTLTVNGIGFDTLSTVYFKGQERLTTFISDSVLTAEIPSSDITVAGSFPVWVTDMWGVSDTLQFVVKAPIIVAADIDVINPAMSLVNPWCIYYGGKGQQV